MHSKLFLSVGFEMPESDQDKNSRQQRAELKRNGYKNHEVYNEPRDIIKSFEKSKAAIQPGESSSAYRKRLYSY